MNNLCSSSGFTFIEIIVAVTILSIIILTLYSLLDVGFAFWDYIDNSRWSYTDLQLAVNRIERDLRSTFFRPTVERYPFKGNMYQVQFFSQEYGTGMVCELMYEYSPYDKTIFLVKSTEKIGLLTDIERCNFYFYHPDYGYWDNYWDALDKKIVPSIVRIVFVFCGSTTEYKYDFPIYIQQKGISGK